jgi:hypothetical protein
MVDLLQAHGMAATEHGSAGAEEFQFVGKATVPELQRSATPTTSFEIHMTMAKARY